MQTPESVRQLLDQVAFHDWRIRLGGDEHGLMWLQVMFDVECQLQSGRKWFVSRHMTDSEVVQTVFAAVLAAVEHEAREFFLYRGVAVFGPHFDVNVLRAAAMASLRDTRVSQ